MPPDYVPLYEDELNEPHGQSNAHLEQPTPQSGMNEHDKYPTYEPPPRAAFNKSAPHNSGTHHRQTTRGAQFGDNAGAEKLNLIEERLKAIEGASFPDLKNAFEMCLVPDVVLPPKFKVPEFEKYNGTTCLKSHLHMYTWKMSAYHGDDKLLIYCFQDSLARVAMNLHIRLEKANIQTFLDMSNAFVRQYKYNEDVAPDRTQLQNMSKKPQESFKEYTQCWRGYASQLLPRLEEEEQLSIFVDTLQNPYYDRLVASMASGFNALIRVGEKIKIGIKSGKIIDDQANTKKPGFMKKKEEIFTYPMGERIIAPIPGRISENPGPWFDPNVSFAYHSRTVGHSIKNCRALKFKVQHLIDSKWLNFRQLAPNVSNNPLPNHGSHRVNVVEKVQEESFLKDVSEIRTPMKVIFKEMCNQVLSIPRGISLDQAQPQWFPYLTKMEPMVTDIPHPFPYESDKEVPWRYDGEVITLLECTLEVTNVIGVSRITRSDRVHGPPETGKNTVTIYKGKEKVDAPANPEIGQEGSPMDDLKDGQEISNEQANEFLKFIKQSEYKVVDHLRRTPARISILSLLMDSEPHMNVLLKILNQAHEIPRVGNGHINPLHISVMFQDCEIGKVLIDNGSSLIVMTKRSAMIVKAFDGSKRELCD
nr:hypothetical protein [Lupinus angustifolius]